MYRLVFLEGPDKGRRVVIRQASVEAGSDPDLRIRLDDPAAREHHAVFIRDHGSVHVEMSIDAQHFIRNGVPLGREPLQHGDVLELGRIRLQYQEMQPLVFHERRRMSRLHLLTVAASIMVIALQAALLGLVLLRRNAPPAPDPVPEQAAPAEPTPETEATAVAALDEIGSRPPPPDEVEDDAPPEEPADEAFDDVEMARPEPLPDLEPTVIERPPEIATPVPAIAEDPETVRPVEAPPPAVVEEEAPPRPPADAPSADAADELPRRVRIAEVAREKFEPGPGFEEARGARVILRPRRSLGPIPPSDVRVELTFYDRNEATGEVAPSQVPVHPPAQPGGPTWPAGDEREVQYRYEVPTGFRAGAGAGHSYYGHLVRLYYRGELEDEYAFPATLLER